MNRMNLEDYDNWISESTDVDEWFDRFLSVYSQVRELEMDTFAFVKEKVVRMAQNRLYSYVESISLLIVRLHRQDQVSRELKKVLMGELYSLYFELGSDNGSDMLLNMTNIFEANKNEANYLLEAGNYSVVLHNLDRYLRKLKTHFLKNGESEDVNPVLEEIDLYAARKRPLYEIDSDAAYWEGVEDGYVEDAGWNRSKMDDDPPFLRNSTVKTPLKYENVEVMRNIFSEYFSMLKQTKEFSPNQIIQQLKSIDEIVQDIPPLQFIGIGQDVKLLEAISRVDEYIFRLEPLVQKFELHFDRSRKQQYELIVLDKDQTKIMNVNTFHPITNKTRFEVSIYGVRKSSKKKYDERKLQIAKEVLLLLSNGVEHVTNEIWQASIRFMEEPMKGYATSEIDFKDRKVIFRLTTDNDRKGYHEINIDLEYKKD